MSDERLRAGTRDRLEDELVRLFVVQEDRGGLRPEDPPRDLDDRAEELPVGILGAEDAGCDGGAELVAIGHAASPTFAAVR